VGTDVHPYVEFKRRDSKWQRAHCTLPRDRDYWAFALLADVRNGVGFAGVDRGDIVVVKYRPRGLPEDTSIHDTGPEIEFGAVGYIWLGDHDISWLTLPELKSIDLDQKITRRGVVNRENAARIARGEQPLEWCSDKSPFIHGQDFRVEWETPARGAALLIVEWIEELERYCRYTYTKEEHVRVVFGFDS
jgi:hypothetical protein